MAVTTTFDPYGTGSEERSAAMARLRAGSGVAETPAGDDDATASGAAR
jgi:hypothetical protein